MITVLKNNVPWGPFTRVQIQDGLTRGDFTLQYLAHGPGQKEWLPLGEILDHYDRASHLPPVPTKDLPSAQPPAIPIHAPAPPPIPPAPATLPPPILETPAASLQPASFFPRFIAFAIDCAVLFLPVLFLFGLGALTIQIEGMVEHNDAETMRQEWILLRRNFQHLLVLVVTGGAWLYGAFLECSQWQATVGKQWIGLKVTDAHGQPLTFFRATGRHLAKFISALPCFLGFTTAAFSPLGLALHDRLAHTRVVKKKS